MSPAPNRGSGSVNPQTVFDRTVSEAVRKAGLSARSDPTVVPPLDDAQLIMGSQIFGRRDGSGGAGGRTLTFGTHLTGSHYDGTSDVTIATDADTAASASTIMARDASGFAAAIQLLLGSTGFIGEGGASGVDIWCSSSSGHIRFQKHDFSATNLDVDDDGNAVLRGNLQVDGHFAFHGNSPVSAVAAPSAAGGAYGATEQALLNDIRQRLINIGVYT